MPAGQLQAGETSLEFSSLNPQASNPPCRLLVLLGKIRGPLCSKATHRQGPGMQKPWEEHRVSPSVSLLEAGEALTTFVAGGAANLFVTS